MPFRSRIIIAVSAAAMALSSCGPREAAEQPAPDVAEVPRVDVFAEAGSGGAEWLTYGGTYDEQRYSLLDAVTPANVGRLGIAWAYDLKSDRGIEATPIVHDGVMYVTASWSVLHAIDAATGEALWVYDPAVARSVATVACCDVVNRGVAFKDGVLFLSVLDGRLEAIDASTGRRLWSVQTTDLSKPYTITGAPRVVKNMVLIGNAGSEFGVRGYVSAYDAGSGKLVWRFYTVPNPNKRLDGAASDDALTTNANSTWSNRGAWKTDGGGGTVWDSIVYDVQNDQILFGVGHGAPWNAELRDTSSDGDNLFLSSIVAVDADSGHYRWHYQETPRDNWGYGATQSILLADLPLGENGSSRRVVMHAPSNGFFYVLDAATGQYISGKAFVPQSWTSGLDPQGRPFETDEARPEVGASSLLTPGFAGARGWQPMAFNPKLGLAFIPAREASFLYTPFENEDPSSAWKSGFAFEAGVPVEPMDKAALAKLRDTAKGSLIAWDPMKQEARWQVDQPAAGSGGVLTTASGLVFQGASDGFVSAYQADTGRRLWRRDLQNGIAAPPISYSLAGNQYVAVATGLGGLAGLSEGHLRDKPVTNNRGLLVAFRLGANAKLPAMETAALPEAGPKAAVFGNAAQQEAGRVLYSRNCAACHGRMAISAGVLPDLRWSPLSAEAAAWRTSVLEADGTKGMPGFAKRLADSDVEAIRAYVLLQANGGANARRPPSNATSRRG